MPAKLTQQAPAAIASAVVRIYLCKKSGKKSYSSMHPNSEALYNLARAELLPAAVVVVRFGIWSTGCASCSRRSKLWRGEKAKAARERGRERAHSISSTVFSVWVGTWLGESGGTVIGSSSAANQSLPKLVFDFKIFANLHRPGPAMVFGGGDG